MKNSRPATPQPDLDLPERLRATTLLLEQIAADFTVVNAVPTAERERLYQIFVQDLDMNRRLPEWPGHAS